MSLSLVRSSPRRGRYGRACGCLLAALLTACADAPAPEAGAIEVTPLRDRAGGEGPLLVALASERSGIAFESRFEWDHPNKHLYAHGFAGGGVSVGDVDGDGLPELYMTGQTGSDRLYRNLGGLCFEVCSYDAPNRLYVNRGDGSFAEEGAARGLDFAGASIMGAFADYDLDGDLDLYVVTNRLYPGPIEDYPRTENVDGKVRSTLDSRFGIARVVSAMIGLPQLNRMRGLR